MSGINQQAVDYCKRLAKKQHKGPFGQYKMPDKPRFKFDPELSRAVSLVPEIEIVSEYGSPGGGGGVFTQIYCSRVRNFVCIHIGFMS